MQIFATDPVTNDFIVSNGQLLIVQDSPGNPAAILQSCAHAAKTRLGEMILAVDQGIPYFETVWVGVPNYQQFQAALRAAFLDVTGVIEVVSLTLTRSGNTLNYFAVIRTIYGIGEVNG